MRVNWHSYPERRHLAFVLCTWHSYPEPLVPWQHIHPLSPTAIATTVYPSYSQARPPPVLQPSKYSQASTAKLGLPGRTAKQVQPSKYSQARPPRSYSQASLDLDPESTGAVCRLKVGDREVPCTCAMHFYVHATRACTRRLKAGFRCPTEHSLRTRTAPHKIEDGAYGERQRALS